MTRFVESFVMAVVLASCQTYDFERVTPLAVAQTTTKTVIASKRLKPNVMLLVDTSGSMLLPTNPSDPACPNGCGTSAGNACPGACPTRMSELKSAMATFLQTSGTIARFGVSTFPKDAVCTGTTDISVPLPQPSNTDTGLDATLTDNANQVNARIQRAMAQGGTPTGASLSFMGDQASLTDANDARDDFVLLLTDGLPNCNPTNPSELCSCGSNCTSMQINACTCTVSSCATSLCALGCLDQTGAVDNVKALLRKGIRTIVVGFGADVASGPGPVVLNAMAKEGNFPRQCKTGMNSECGTGNTCDATTKLCSTAFYQASNGTELAAALAKISDAIDGRKPCEFDLATKPSDPKYLSVVIDGQSVTEGPNTFSYDYGINQVKFLGMLCQRLETSTTQNPVGVEFRIVERF